LVLHFETSSKLAGSSFKYIIGINCKPQTATQAE